MSSTVEPFGFVSGFECPHESCTDTFPAEHPAADHAQGKHDLSVDESDIQPSEQSVEEPEQLLEALYNINSHAKKYARLGTENYRKGKKATAKQNSVKKDALYELKHQIIRGLARAGEVTKAERHRIDGTLFVCHYFEINGVEWSFHTPVDQWNGPEVAGEIQTLDDFESDEEKERSDMSLKDALKYIQAVTGLSANEYLTQQYVSYGRESYFAGWTYLSDED